MKIKKKFIGYKIRTKYNKIVLDNDPKKIELLKKLGLTEYLTNDNTKKSADQPNDSDSNGENDNN